MGYSSLVSYRMMTSHKSSGRGGHKPIRIAIHHMAGNLSVEQCGNVFKNCQVSAHYGIGNDGRIGVYVDENDTAWALGNFAWNQKTINIELANDSGAPNWHVSDKVIERCIDLVVDIAYRLGWSYIAYDGTLSGSDIIAHRWIASTACPGPYMMNNGKLKYIAQQADKKLKEKRGAKPTPTPAPTPAPTGITVDGKLGTASVKKMQKWLGTTQDGVVSGQRTSCKKYIPAACTNWKFSLFGSGSAMVKALQKKLGLKVDGIWGYNTSYALQKYLVKNGAKLTVDGYFGVASAKALQTYLNKVVK